VKNNFAIVLKRIDGKNLAIPEELVKLNKDAQPNSTDLSPYIHSELRSSIAFVITSLLAYPDFPTNPEFNKLCNTLLKTT
jgi:hypothetical protein